uniref:Uncharacterized protein n=1 Tax=Strigamia maritima TaxID=126957 RepID=T1IW14_STRMM
MMIIQLFALQLTSRWQQEKKKITFEGRRQAKHKRMAAMNKIKQHTAVFPSCPSMLIGRSKGLSEPYWGLAVLSAAIGPCVTIAALNEAKRGHLLDGEWVDCARDIHFMEESDGLSAGLNRILDPFQVELVTVESLEN